MQNCHYQTKPLAFALSPSASLSLSLCLSLSISLCLSLSLDPSASLSLCLGAAELSGSSRADSSAPVPPGGRQKTKHGWTAAVTLRRRPLRKLQRAQISPVIARSRRPAAPAEQRKSEFLSKEKGEKSTFHAQVVKSSRDLLYFYRAESIRHQRGHLFIYLFQLLFFAHFYFPCPSGSHTIEKQTMNARGPAQTPNMRFYAFVSKGTETAGEPSTLPPRLPPRLPLPPVGKSDSGDINAFRK